MVNITHYATHTIVCCRSQRSISEKVGNDPIGCKADI